jgi:hypothetical protein
VNYGESLQNAVEREVSGTRAGLSVLYNVFQVLEETGLESVANERVLHNFSPFHFFSASKQLLLSVISFLVMLFLPGDHVWVGQFIGPAYHYTVIDFIAWVRPPLFTPHKPIPSTPTLLLLLFLLLLLLLLLLFLPLLQLVAGTTFYQVRVQVPLTQCSSHTAHPV